MNSQKDKGHVWRRVKVIAFLPLAIFIWMIGWTLYSLGDQTALPRNAKKETMTAFNEEDFERSTAREESARQVLT